MFAQKLKIADCHCDTIWLMEKEEYEFSRRNAAGHIDLPRLREGGVGLQFFAICTAPLVKEGYLHVALQQINRYHRNLSLNGDLLQSLEQWADLATAGKEQKIGALLALEGAEPLEGDPELIHIFYLLGVRALSLTWNHRNPFADGVGEEPAGGGLTLAGRDLVKNISSLGIVLDLAHLAVRCFFEALELAAYPPLVSHANIKNICAHPRNLSDEQLKALASRGGVIGMSFYPRFITGGEEAGLDQLIDHFIYAADLIGVEHIAFGSDFDGIDRTVTGIEDAASYQNLPEALEKRGFRPREIELIARGNVERLLQANLDRGMQP
ncbi:MAG: membrane dipeptidase [Firmicutes bacterium]|nr:membrane dipeptidase [Bacillota bacterium]